MAVREKDITGQIFSCWMALERAGTSASRDPLWKFLCICGKEKIVIKKSVLYGMSKSCGCKQKEYSDAVRIVHKLPFGEAAFNQLLHAYKRGAQRRNFLFELKRSEFKKLTQENCVYCGTTPKTNHHVENLNGDYVYNGVDRIDNTKGYIRGNCVSCCKICNLAKHTLTLAEFLDWIQRVKNHEVTICKQTIL